MRPMYETEQDLRNEQHAISRAEQKWNCVMMKLPIRYHLDFIAKRGDKAVAFCEVKTRNYSMEKIGLMGGYLMSIGKWSAAKQLHDCSGLPFILIVRTLDGIWYATFRDFTPDNVLIRGRTDRDDWQDVEPCVLLDVAKFSKLEA